MNWIVWHMTDEDFVEVARFADESDACAFAVLKGDNYVPTAVNETPVW